MKIEGGPFHGGQLTVTKHDSKRGTLTVLSIEKEGIVLSVSGASPTKLRELAAEFRRAGEAVSALGSMLNEAIDAAP